MSKPFSTVQPWDMVAQGYAETNLPFFSPYAQSAMELAGMSEDQVILDLACGPGTLSLLAFQQVKEIYALDFSLNMLQCCQQNLRAAGSQNVYLKCADGQSLPYADESFHRVFSLFGLMFFPDRQRAYGEILRCLKPGGKAVISSWAPVGDSPAMQIMFGGIRAMKPEIPEPQVDIESLEDPRFFQQEMQAAGFTNVEVKAVVKDFPINSVEELWDILQKGSAPIVAMKNSMSEGEWAEKAAVAQAYFRSQLPDLPTQRTTKAWLAVGEK